MSKVLKFLQDSKVFFLATSDGDQARVRPLGFVMEYEGKISFCTSNTKSMSKQLKANPKAEISAVAGDHQTLRITGKVAFNPSKAAKEKALEVAPQLKRLYSADDGIFEIFHFEKGATALFTDMQGGREEIKL